MNAPEVARGQPLLVMAVILGSWLAVRAFMWEMPSGVEARRAASLASHDDGGRSPSRALAARVPSHARPGALRPGQPGTAARLERKGAAGRNRTRLVGASLAGFSPVIDMTGKLAASGRTDLAERLVPSTSASVTLPERQSERAQFTVADRPLLGPALARTEPRPSRWSGDAWLLWRDGSGAAVAPGIAAYGRSQAGAVLRYRLDRTGERRPTAYLRATSALQSPRQAEVAAGLSARPLAVLPVVIAAEARIADTDSGRQVRPAAFAVTELPPATLPLGLRGEAYLQAGYVGGRYGTAFVDGQARIDGGVAPVGNGEGLRLGVAAWGGAQRDTSRLDVGPSATLTLAFGDATARFAADYRFRIAGDALPASGPALTFSAGF